MLATGGKLSCSNSRLTLTFENIQLHLSGVESQGYLKKFDKLVGHCQNHILSQSFQYKIFQTNLTTEFQVKNCDLNIAKLSPSPSPSCGLR